MTPKAKDQEKTSVLTLRLGADDCLAMEKIKQKHQISTSTKATQFMLRRFSDMEKEIETLRQEKYRLEREVSEFKKTWNDYRFSLRQMDRLCDSK